MDDLNSDVEMNKKAAAFTVKVLTDTLALVNAEIAGLKRWILTSLLAINGAAAVATWQVSMQPEYKVSACILFIIGLTLPLISAEISTNKAPALMEKVGNQIGYWLTVEHDGIRSGELENLAPLNAMVKNHRRLPTALAWASLGVFVLGLSVSGAGAFPGEKSKHQAGAAKSQVVQKNSQL